MHKSTGACCCVALCDAVTAQQVTRDACYYKSTRGNDVEMVMSLQCNDRKMEIDNLQHKYLSAKLNSTQIEIINRANVQSLNM